MFFNRFRVTEGCIIRTIGDSVQIVGRTGLGITTSDCAGLRSILAAFLPPATVREAYHAQTNLDQQSFELAALALIESGILVDESSLSVSMESFEARHAKCLEAIDLLERLTVESAILAPIGQGGDFDGILNDILLTVVERAHTFRSFREGVTDD